MQRGGLKLNYANSDKILTRIGFNIDRNIELFLAAPIPMGHIILNHDFDKYTLTHNYKRVPYEAHNSEENIIPVIIHTQYPKTQPLYMFIQPTKDITYNYILLELLIKRLFVDLEDGEVNLLINTLNQFKKVYLIDVGNLGIRLPEIFDFLIMRCYRESISGHDQNLYLFFDKTPEAKEIEEENFEKSFIKYIKLKNPGYTDIDAERYRNTIGKNMMIIRAFGIFNKGKKEINQVSTSNALDDFMFWLLAISINNIFDSNLSTKCNINNPKCFNTNLILISSDKQKINDPNGNKNLFTELKEIQNFVIYVNGIENILISKTAKFISDKIITTCGLSDCNPSKYHEDIGIKNAKSCLSESYNNDKQIENERNDRFWLYDKITANDQKMLYNLKTVVSSMNNIHPGNYECNLFEKIMTLIRYLQYIYFDCAEKIEKDNIRDTKKPYESKSAKHLKKNTFIPKCAMDQNIRLDFVNDHY